MRRNVVERLDERRRIGVESALDLNGRQLFLTALGERPAGPVRVRPVGNAVVE